MEAETGIQTKAEVTDGTARRFIIVFRELTSDKIPAELGTTQHPAHRSTLSGKSQKHF